MPDFTILSSQVNSNTLRPLDDLPGPPFGPRYLRTTTVFSPFLIDPASTACTNSSSESNTRAFPVNPRPSFPVIFAIAPAGARLPVSTLGPTNVQRRAREDSSAGTDLMCPVSLIGLSNGRITSWLLDSSPCLCVQRSRFSPRVRPVTVKLLPSMRLFFMRYARTSEARENWIEMLKSTLVLTRNAADFVNVLHHVFTTGLEICDERDPI
jgi:hypothetical protein